MTLKVESLPPQSYSTSYLQSLQNVKSSQSSYTISFNELIDLVSQKLSVPEQLTPSQIDHEHLQELLRKYSSSESDWLKFALEDPARSYTRNGICDFKENANLLLLVWNPGQGSAIHDHAQAHCCMKILKGELTEELFHTPTTTTIITTTETSPAVTTKTMEAFKKTTLIRNDVAYISDDIGLHRISNKGDVPAVSLHLYTPPYAKKFGCNTYSDVGGTKTHVSMANLYSWNGEVINHENHSNC